MEISGHAAIVTGGASGLGEASARALAEAGAKVAIFDMQRERGDAVAREIGGVFCSVDVTDGSSVDAGLARAREAHGAARMVVNCAGIVAGSRTVAKKRDTSEFMAHDLALFTKVVTVNLVGTFHVASKAAREMMALDPVTPDGGRGLIVMTSSVAAEDGQIGQAAYSASKGGVAALTLPMARDLAGNGIRVVSIMPGLFETPMFSGFTDEVRASLGASVPFPQRLGRPQEYAALVRHIVENDMLNGSAIRLDGAVRLAPK